MSGSGLTPHSHGDVASDRWDWDWAPHPHPHRRSDAGLDHRERGTDEARGLNLRTTRSATKMSHNSSNGNPHWRILK